MGEQILPGPAVASAGPPSTVTATRRSWLQSAGVALTGMALTPLRLLSPQAAAAAAEAGPPIRLSLNENPLGSSPRVAEAIRNALTDLHRYTEGEAVALTALLAAKEGVPPAQIVLGEILGSLGTQLSLTGGPGGEFVYSTPGFTDLVEAAGQTGGRAVGVPLNAHGENDLPAIAAQTGARTRAVYLVNPHNPSGTATAAGPFRAFVRELAARTLVIIDEAYLEFTDDFAGRTLVDLVRAGSNVAVFRTFDKAYGLAGLQFGYAVVPAVLAAALRQQGVGAAHAQNRLAVVAAAAAVADTDFLARSRRLVVTERARWNAALQELGLRRTESEGNFVFFDARRPHGEVAAALLAEGIQVGRSFPPLDTWVRISIGLPEENTRAIAALRKVVEPV